MEHTIWYKVNKQIDFICRHYPVKVFKETEKSVWVKDSYGKLVRRPKHSARLSFFKLEEEALRCCFDKLRLEETELCKKMDRVGLSITQTKEALVNIANQRDLRNECLIRDPWNG